MNAVRHGILSKQVLILGESEAELRDLWESLRDELRWTPIVGQLGGVC